MYDLSRRIAPPVEAFLQIKILVNMVFMVDPVFYGLLTAAQVERTTTVFFG
jgi:hypothetical protein